MWEIEEWFMIAFLGIGAVWDLIRREIPVWYLFAGTLGVLIYQIFWREEATILLLFGALTGVVFLLVSKFSKEGIGYGDSWMILILGIYLGVWKLLVALAVAFLCTAIFAGIGMMRKFCQRKTRLPFLPFLMIGFLSIYGW